MRCSSLLAVFALSVASARAQYFSEGWQPGQPASTPSVATEAEDDSGFESHGDSQAQGQANPKAERTYYSPPKPEGTPLTSLKDLTDINKVLKSPTSVNLFRAFGINITERVDAAAARLNPWDDRIPLITDDNYVDLVVNEELSEEEEKSRAWMLVV
jgi:hypothetical protein